jgi:predicted outer membrane protein
MESVIFPGGVRAPRINSISEKLTMERMQKVIWWSSKSRATVLAAFAITAISAGRAAADPSAPERSIDDAGIARRVLAMNRAEEQVSQAVKGKLVSAAVWQLADRMEADRADLDQQFREFAGGGREPAPAAQGQADGVDLSKLSGQELEEAYVDREVKTHEVMLATLGRDLIPNAKNPVLRARLGDLGADLSAELQHARNVQYAEWFWHAAAEERSSTWGGMTSDYP